MKKLLKAMITFSLVICFATSSQAESYVMHTVNEGDTLWKLSKAHQEDVNSLLSINNKKDISLDVGDFIKIKTLNTDIKIHVNEKKINPDTSPYLDNNRTFVPISFITEALGAEIKWDGSISTAIITDKNKTILLPVGSKWAYVNGKSHQLDASIKLYNGRVFIPIRFVSEVLGYKVAWNQKMRTAYISTDYHIDNNSFTEEDLYWLSRIVSSESSAEPYEGKLAVANVILNRKKNKEYPSTIKSVIFDKNYGYQFTPAANGTIYNTPTGESVQAAKEALEGKNNIGNALYFVNPRKSNLNWIQQNRNFYKTIKNHDFYL